MTAKILTMGELIRTLRHRAKLSQTDLAKVVGVHFSSISRWERDQLIEEMRIKHLRRIATATSVSFSDLLDACRFYEVYSNPISPVLASNSQN